MQITEITPDSYNAKSWKWFIEKAAGKAEASFRKIYEKVAADGMFQWNTQADCLIKFLKFK